MNIVMAQRAVAPLYCGSILTAVCIFEVVAPPMRRGVCRFRSYIDAAWCVGSRPGAVFMQKSGTNPRCETHRLDGIRQRNNLVWTHYLKQTRRRIALCMIVGPVHTLMPHTYATRVNEKTTCMRLATVTISSSDGVMRPLRPMMSALCSTAASRIFSHGVITPRSITYEPHSVHTSVLYAVPASPHP